MNKQILVALLLISVIVVAGCTSQSVQKEKTLADGTVVKPDGTIVKPNGVMVKPDGTMIAPEGSPAGTIVKEDGTVVKPDGTMVKPDGTMILSNGTMIEPENKSATSVSASYSGAVLAGSSSPVLDFNKADYDKSLQSGKLVVLYFYANWCPICRAEVPQLYSAFNELKTDKVIGFRVNFNDDQTDGDERALAQQFQVPYQHSKVFVKNGIILLKSPETWDKNRYLLEINKAAM